MSLLEVLFLFFFTINGENIKLPLQHKKLLKRESKTISINFMLSSELRYNININNSYDRVYTLPLYIGNPIKLFNVIFDSGSYNLWVFSSQNECDNVYCQYGSILPNICDYECCVINGKNTVYNHDDSITYKEIKPKQEWNIQYGRGSANGFESTDVLTLNNITINDVTFGEAINWNNNGILSCYEQVSGIMGFGIKDKCYDNEYNTFMEIIYDNGIINNKIFSVKLTDNSDDSMLIIGDIDDTLYDHLIYTDLVQPYTTGMWLSETFGVSLNNELTLNNTYYIDNCNDGCLLLIDTGSSYIGLPTTVYNKFIEKLLSINNNTCGYYSTKKHSLVTECDNCDFICLNNNFILEYPNIYFELNNHSLSLNPLDYMLSGDYCYDYNECQGSCYCLGFSYIDIDEGGITTYILGDTFIRKYYIIFDETNLRLGFGKTGSNFVSNINQYSNTNFEFSCPNNKQTFWQKFIQFCNANWLYIALTILALWMIVLYCCCRRRKIRNKYKQEALIHENMGNIEQKNKRKKHKKNGNNKITNNDPTTKDGYVTMNNSTTNSVVMTPTIKSVESINVNNNTNNDINSNDINNDNNNDIQTDTLPE